jgi:hypothetical protein
MLGTAQKQEEATMLPSLHESVTMFTQENNRSEANFGNRRRSIRQYRRAYARGRLHQLLGSLHGRGNSLQDLSTALTDLRVKARHYAGTRSVPIEQITGSEGRSRDFDADFHPVNLQTEDRWIGIATAQRTGEVLPPVELIQLGEVYFVRDGHHRISVARALGQKDIDAVVIVWEIETAVHDSTQ